MAVTRDNDFDPTASTGAVELPPTPLQHEFVVTADSTYNVKLPGVFEMANNIGDGSAVVREKTPGPVTMSFFPQAETKVVTAKDAPKSAQSSPVAETK